MSALLEIDSLSVGFPVAGGYFSAVEGVDLAVDEGEILSIVGESGSGKSVCMLALMGLLPSSAQVSAGGLRFKGLDLLDTGVRRRVIGKDIAMIFQEPVASLNPCFSVGYQICEILRYHLGLGKRAARSGALELLSLVGITDPENRLDSYPYQLSGGICQRIGIAMALACEPSLLIADEPTTALDVTIQSQILELLLDLQAKNKMSLILITHDMGVVSEMAERVMVFYAGRPVELQDKVSLLDSPKHPYTKALLSALPEHYGHRRVGGRIASIRGVVPGQFDSIGGCLFHPRCDFAKSRCRGEVPSFLSPDEDSGDDVRVACHYPLV